MIRLSNINYSRKRKKDLITRLKTQELMEWSLYHGAYYQCHYFGGQLKQKKKIGKMSNYYT